MREKQIEFFGGLAGTPCSDPVAAVLAPPVPAFALADKLPAA